MERSNWKDANNPRRLRIFIPLAAALVIAAGVIVAFNGKAGLTAFTGSTACATPTLGTPSPAGNAAQKGAESVKGAAPAASPTARPAPVVSAPPARGTASPATVGAGQQAAVKANCAQQKQMAAQQPQHTAVPNADCTLIVPSDPLSARGLATPYQLTATDVAMGPCNEANPDQGAFVQATILDPATGELSVYSPLVVDKGMRPAVAPVVPKLPRHAVVGIWFGFNGDNLTLRSSHHGLWRGRCVNGLGDSVFGQYAYCNAISFFREANKAIKRGKLVVPPLGRASDGMPCPSVRDFFLIDQDQSDNVQTTYLADGDGRIAQNTAANKAKLAGATTLGNPSDNALLDVFVDPALGCKAAMAPDLADNGAMTFSLAMDELQAAAGQAAPAALVPLNNPMTMVGDKMSRLKTDLYRAGVDQPPLPAGQTPQQYCMQMDTIQAARLQKDQAVLAKTASPMPDAANNLFTFLGMRLQASFGNLNCQNYGLQNPVADLVMQNNVVVGVQFAGPAGNNNNGNNNGNGGTTASPTTSATASPSASASAPNDGGAGSPTAGPTTSGYPHRHRHHRH